jgi:starch synthase
VVASDVGGIPEVVADGETGLLVHYDPADPAGFEAGLSATVNSLIADPEKAVRFGRAGRQRCIDEFSWAHIAEQTLQIYRKMSS